MEYFNEAINTLSKLGPEGFCFLACIAVGYLVKLVPWIPNKHIPWMCILSGPAIYPFLTNYGRVSPDSQHPIVRIVLTGLIISVVSWMAHYSIIWRVEKWLKAKMEAAGSTRYRKAADGTFEAVKDEGDKKPPTG